MQLYEDNILDNAKVCKGSHATSLFFPKLKEHNNYWTSDNFYDFGKKTCYDETYYDETCTLTCKMIAIIFISRMYHESNPMKKGFRVLLKLHFEVDTSNDVANANLIRIHDAPINMDEKDYLFLCLRTQLREFFRDILSVNNAKTKYNVI